MKVLMFGLHTIMLITIWLVIFVELISVFALRDGVLNIRENKIKRRMMKIRECKIFYLIVLNYKNIFSVVMEFTKILC